MLHRVVIVGGGFAGLHAAQALRGAPVDIALIDRQNYHLFQPLLYQVATGGLSPADISAPLRSILRKHRSARVLLGDVDDLRVDDSTVVLRDGAHVPYDTLILATGVRHHYFGNDTWESRAPGLKNVDDATRIRGRILTAFEAAERAGADERARLLTFLVVGAGPTGVELAGAIGELARHTLREDFRAIDPADARILLVEGAGRVLPGYPEPLSAAAARSLERLGIDVRTNTLVTEVGDGGVSLVSDGSAEKIPARTVLWAAGVRGSRLGRLLSERAGAQLDGLGRVVVDNRCRVPGHPDICVIGDLAAFVQDGEPLPGVAPVAMQQGRYAARLIRDRLNENETPPFRYRDRGSLAVIGRAAAVADLGRMRFTGYPAWLLWLFIHIMYLVDFENRLLVFTQWAYSYFTKKRGARLITGAARVPPEPHP